MPKAYTHAWHLFVVLVLGLVIVKIQTKNNNNYNNNDNNIILMAAIQTPTPNHSQHCFFILYYLALGIFTTEGI